MEGGLLGHVGLGFMFFAVAERVVHRRVDQVGGAHVVPQVLLALGDLAVSLGVSIVEIVVVRVVSE